MYVRILVAYDGSPPARAAVERAAELSRRDGAALTILTVATLPTVADDVETEADIERARRHHQSLLHGLEARCRELGVSPAKELAVGHPVRQILNRAEDADLVVIGHSGRGMIDRWLMGSVAHGVVSLAPCDVLVVR